MRDQPHRPELLLVDDERFNLKTFVRVFRKEYNITTAGSAAEALDKIDDAPYDVALIDYRMSGTSGVTLVKRLSVSHPELPCVLLTGSPSAVEVQSALRDGFCVEVVGKPWSKASISACVARCLARVHVPQTGLQSGYQASSDTCQT